MTTAQYYVEGVPLVNCGGEMCESCERRPAVGRSVSAHLMCARCLGWHTQMADEYAREIEDANARRAARQSADLARIRLRSPELAEKLADVEADRREAERRIAAARFACGHDRTPENTYQNQRGRIACRECRRKQHLKNKAQARKREQARLARGKSDGASPYFGAP